MCSDVLFGFNFFQSKFTLNIILYSFQVYGIVVRQPYTVQSIPPDIPSTQLVPYIVIIIISYAVLYIPMTIL